MSYNILHNPSLYALYESGETKEISILTLFRDAQKISSISGDFELQEFALTRFLIAILYRSYAGKINTLEGWETIWENGIDYKVIEDYLLSYEEKFDLFSDVSPFYQVTKEEGQYLKEDSVIDNQPLLLDHQRVFYNSNPKENNLYFSNSRLSGIQSISPAEAFRNLVTLQGYNTASKKSILKNDPRVDKKFYAQLGWMGNFSGVLIVGKNLEETLLLNTVPYAMIKDIDVSAEDDLAVWEKEPQSAAPSNDFWKQDSLDSYGLAQGIVEMLTFQSSRVSLRSGEDNNVTGSVVGVGDRIFVYDQYVETMAAHKVITRKESGNVMSNVPVTLRGGSLWRNIDALLAFADTDQKTHYTAPLNVRFFQDILAKDDYDDDYNVVDVKVFTVFYGAQSAIISDWVVSSLNISKDAFNDETTARTLIQSAKLASDVTYTISCLDNNIKRASGNTSNITNESLKNLVLSKFEEEYSQLASSITPENISVKQEEWSNIAKKIAYEISDELTQSVSSAAMRGISVRNQKTNKQNNYTIFNALNMFNSQLNKNLKGAFNG